MDINGAKALKKRLERAGAPSASAAAPTRDVSADAPPVYHWTGVEKPRSEGPSTPTDDEPEAPAVSLLRRLVPSFR